MTRLPLWWAIVLGLAAVSCGVDEDALVCGPDRVRNGDRCIPGTPSDADLSTDISPDQRTAGPCADTLDCPAAFVCEGALPSPVCVRACNTPGAFPCADGYTCSVAGLCLPLGDALPGASCEPAVGCVAQYACRTADDSASCALVCDPRANTCPGDSPCESSPSGLGYCSD